VTNYTAQEPLDDLDIAVLDEVAGLFAAADPMPDGLVERVRFALALEEIDAEVARLAQDLSARVRGGEEQTRTITFDCASLTIMITVSRLIGGAVRVDGWLAPPGTHRVELRTADGPLSTDADEQGCFVLKPVPHGLAQLVVRARGERPDGWRSVVTPSIVV
jgi:hypothetical protein